MALIGLALLALPSLMLALKAAESRLYARETAVSPVEGAERLAPAATYPDVYYVVLDAYARGDVLQDLYSLDNSAFLQALTARGFYVASKSRANYSQTAQSLASSLNSTYLDDLALSRGAESVNSAPLQEMVQHSLVRRSLKGLGCQTAAFETSYPLTELTDADRFLTPPYGELARSEAAAFGLPLEEFETLLLETTLLRPVVDAASRQQANARSLISFPYQKHRMQVEFSLASLADAGLADGPQFEFAHVVSPHPPFVFGRFGEEVIPSRPFSRQDVGCCDHEE